MKIAIVTYSLHIGGVESVIFNLAISFKMQGHLVEVIETESRGEWTNYFKENHIIVKTYRLNLFTIPIINVFRISNYLKSFDCIFINDAPYAQAGIGLLNSKIKIFPILHNNLESMIRNALSSYGQWNKLICVSPKIKTIIDDRIENDFTTFIPNGIEPIEFIQRNYNGSINFLYVGRIEDSQKGVFLLPKIANLLKNKKIDFKIDVIGDGSSYSELQQMIKDLCVSDVFFLRKALSHNEVVNLMKTKHFLLMPSYYEGMPIVLLEAMSCGLIPIVSYLPGHTDICVKDNITGFFGLPGNVESFIQVIEHALKNKALLNNISKNASEIIHNEFSMAVMINSYLKVIKNDSIEIVRNNRIDHLILPEVPYMPIILWKAVRKTSRIFHLLK